VESGVPHLLDLSDRVVPSPVTVHRVASAVVTDDDLHAFDALVTGVPLLRMTVPDAGPEADAALDEGWQRPSPCPGPADVLGELTALHAAGFPRRAVTVPTGAPPLDGAAARRVVQRLRALRRR
jgi:hypothetical protein